MIEMVQVAVVAAAAGVALGMVLSGWAWRSTIRSKAASGFRLECGGALCQVMIAEDYDDDQIIRNTLLGE